MIPDTLKYIVISDIHLGHKRNPTTNIIKALTQFFLGYEDRDDIRIIFLAGDVFDGLLDLSDDDVFDIVRWILWLLRFCHHKNIKLRVLEGTPRHDRGQSKLFESVHAASNLSVDLKYIKTLHIEYMDDYDLHILYIPDEWNASTEKTFQEVKSCMTSLSIDKVDISIMHGMFGYQIPNNVKTVPKHSEIDYLSITRYFIHIGHVHIFSVYERIIANGSFDRIAHGEESPKGGVEVAIRKDGTGQYWFIENKLAMIFLTLTIRNKDMDSVLKYVTRRFKNIPPQSHIRLRASHDHPCMAGLDYLKTYFPTFQFTKMSLDDVVEEDYQLISDTVIDESIYIPITLTRDNLKTLLFEDIQQNHPWSSHQWSLAEQEIQNVIS